MATSGKEQRAAALFAPAQSDGIAKSSFSAEYTTGYAVRNDFKPVATTATFDFGRLGDAPAGK